MEKVNPFNEGNESISKISETILWMVVSSCTSTSS